jgi:hypothetical protein
LKKANKNELFSENIESGFLEIIKPQVAFMFNHLKRMPPELEKEWKDLFAKNIILYIDGFLYEMSEELKIPYNKDFRIEHLKRYIEESI